MLTYQFINVLVGTNDDIAIAVHDTAGMAVSDYLIMQQIAYAGTPLEIADFASSLLLQRNTVSVAVSRLEQRGLVEKRADATDARRRPVALTEQGAVAADAATEGIRRKLLEDFWFDATDERVNWGMVVDMRTFVENGMGTQGAGSTSLTDTHLVIPAWIAALRCVEQLWAHALRTFGGMTLGEFRVLDQLVRAAGPVSPSEVALEQGMKMSFVSRTVASLREKDLANAVPARDRRSLPVEASEAGRREHARVWECLAEATERYYAPLSPAEQKRLIGWHTTMYENRMARKAHA